MKNFIFHNPTKLIFGTNSMEQIAENVKLFGEKVLVLYGGGSIKKNGIYEKVMKQLTEFEVKEFGGIEPNPRVETVRKIISEYRIFEPDLILAVGGGSVIDACKLLATSFYYEGDPWDFVAKDKIKETRKIPFGTVLTISATGSEMNSGAVITNWQKNEKKAMLSGRSFPKFSILDPQNTYSLPKNQTAFGVVDAFSHVFEQYIHTLPDTSLQDRMSEGILKTLIENAPIAIESPNNYEARANIMYSATMALNGIIRMGVGEDWATHRIEHELSAFYDIPHAQGLAIITPRWMEVVKDQKKDKIIQYGKRIWDLNGDDDEIIDNAIKKTYDFFGSLGIKMTLKEIEIDNSKFEIISERLKDSVGEIPMSKKQILEILELSL